MHHPRTRGGGGWGGPPPLHERANQPAPFGLGFLDFHGKIFHGWVNKKSFNFQTGKKGHVSKYSLKKRAVLRPLMRVAS